MYSPGFIFATTPSSARASEWRVAIGREASVSGWLANTMLRGPAP